MSTYLALRRSGLTMSSQESGSDKTEATKERSFRTPGLRGVQTTTLFRAVTQSYSLNLISQ
uniref:Uncharacterized protein n=1 Tax=Anguilla anguilla TaxID=7936 RepID=A0A0E9WW17_ANGAN